MAIRTQTETILAPSERFFSFTLTAPLSTEKASSLTLSERVENFLHQAADLSLGAPERLTLIQEQRKAENIICQLATFLVDVIRPAQELAITRQRKESLARLVQELEKLLVCIDPKIQNPAAFLGDLENMVIESEALAERKKMLDNFREEQKRQFFQEAGTFCKEHIVQYFEERRLDLLDFNRSRREEANLINDLIDSLTTRVQESLEHLLLSTMEIEQVASIMIEEYAKLRQFLAQCKQALTEV